MDGQARPRLPECEPQDCRRQAEDFLLRGDVDVDVPKAIAWALLAIAGDLHAIRRQSSKR